MPTRIWLERIPDKDEVVGSTPISPTHLAKVFRYTASGNRRTKNYVSEINIGFIAVSKLTSRDPTTQIGQKLFRNNR